MEISRRALEKLTTSLSVALLSLMVVVLTLVVANYTFNWNLFPEYIERGGMVFITSCFFIIIASTLINVMINIGRIADHFDSDD